MFEPARPEDIRAMIFDFDGTLAFQTLDFALMRRRALEALSRYAPVSDAAGEPAMEELDRFCAALEPETAALARKAALEAIAEVEYEAAGRSYLFPFVRPVLAALCQRNIACAVITRNIRPCIEMIFPDVDDHFTCILTRDDVPKVKPHPDHLLRALDSVACPPGMALMVGDHPMDIEVGKKAGTLTAGVASGHTPLDRLAGENPTWLANDLGQLMDLLGLYPESL